MRKPIMRHNQNKLNLSRGQPSDGEKAVVSCLVFTTRLYKWDLRHVSNEVREFLKVYGKLYVEKFDGHSVKLVCSVRSLVLSNHFLLG